MFARLREIFGARKALYDAGYWDAGKAVPMVTSKITHYLAFAPNHTSTDYLGNILSESVADGNGAFAACTKSEVPPCWCHEAYVRGYYQRLVDYFETAFVKLELLGDAGDLPRSRIKLCVQGCGCGVLETANKVVQLPVKRML